MIERHSAFQASLTNTSSSLVPSHAGIPALTNSDSLAYQMDALQDLFINHELEARNQESDIEPRQQWRDMSGQQRDDFLDALKTVLQLDLELEQQKPEFEASLERLRESEGHTGARIRQHAKACREGLPDFEQKADALGDIARAWHKLINVKESLPHANDASISYSREKRDEAQAEADEVKQLVEDIQSGARLDLPVDDYGRLKVPLDWFSEEEIWEKRLYPQRSANATSPDPILPKLSADQSADWRAAAQTENFQGANGSASLWVRIENERIVDVS